MLVLMPEATAEAIRASAGDWGYLGVNINAAEGLVTVESWSVKENSHLPAAEGWRDHDFPHEHHGADGYALWYRGTAELHDIGRHNSIREIPTPVSVIKEQTTGMWQHYKRATLIVTHCERDSKTEWAAWHKSAEDELTWVKIEIFEPDSELLAPLDVAWPRKDLANKLVTVIGLGSIGGAACEAMAAYGLRRFVLIDHDRLEAHNFARHRSPRRHHGRFKVNSVADLLKDRDGSVEVEPIISHVGFEADAIRPLMQESAIVACFADGPDARRMTSHLAFWARRKIVLACVLGFGRYGEILRLHPGRTGCFECNRDSFSDAMGIEKNLEVVGLEERLRLDEGSQHTALDTGWSNYQIELGDIRTTAVTGDLHLVGSLAAKVLVASLLSSGGLREQSLPGDHALLGLRPPIDGDPAPFDQVAQVGSLAWFPTPPPANDCPTCSLGAPG